MTYAPATVLEVSAWGRRIGAVALDPATGLYAFEYDESWLHTGVELAPLHMPRRAGVYEFPELARTTFYGLPAMLADALPDRFGSALVTAWMSDQGIGASQITPLDRLAYAGSRALGALSFAPPAGPETGEPSLVQVARLVTAARSALRGTLREDAVHDALADLITVGSTAGGARAKAVIAFNPETYEMLSGQFSAPEGFEQWLIKLDGVGDPAVPGTDPLTDSQPYGRVEYAYYLMARSAGIEMSESRLLLEGPRAHFLTRRFDRAVGNERIHSQTLCALAHLDYNMARTHSYSSYFLTARELGLGSDAAREIFRRALFNVAGVNRDDHTKNASFLLAEHESWHLAPAYDVTHSYWDAEWPQAHQMSVNAKFAEISLDDFRTLGDRHEVPAIGATIEQVNEAIDHWPDFATQAGVDATTTATVAADIERFRPR
jgi:serine/threonine-protein kinase HipA